MSALSQAWRWLRTLAGDDAYEQYCEHQRRAHPNQPVLDRRSYYLQALEEKWSGIHRCC